MSLTIIVLLNFPSIFVLNIGYTFFRYLKARLSITLSETTDNMVSKLFPFVFFCGLNFFIHFFYNIYLNKYCFFLI